MNIRDNKKNQTIAFNKLKKFSISALSLIVCGVTATSALADTYSLQKCTELSWQYDDIVEAKRALEPMMGMCQIGLDNVCDRTGQIVMEDTQEVYEKEAARLKDELINNCPSYSEGL